MEKFFSTEDATPGASIEVIREFEKTSGRKLPEALIRLLQTQNGGTTEAICFKPEIPVNPRFENGVPIYEFTGIGRMESYLNLLEETADYVEEWEMPAEILILFGGGDWWVFLDYREENTVFNEPAVSLFDSDFDTDIVLAENFESFLDQLEELVYNDEDWEEEVWEEDDWNDN